MTRAARNASEAAEALLAWLRNQRGGSAGSVDDGAAAATIGSTDEAELPALPGVWQGDLAPIIGDAGPPAALPALHVPPAPAPAPAAAAADGKARAEGGSHAVGTAVGTAVGMAVAGDAGPHAPLRLPHTDWLYHRLTITGPAEAVAGVRETAAGAGIIPWQLDLERMEEDLFHLLIAPPPPHARTLSVVGARVLAGQLRDAVERRHGLAVARVGRTGRAGGSRACPFDLHALLPVPDDVLRLGPDDAAARRWLWENWGTTQALRHVADDAAAGLHTRRPPATPSALGEAVFAVTFWSADWTPWRALAQLAHRWSGLRLDVRPHYGDS